MRRLRLLLRHMLRAMAVVTAVLLSPPVANADPTTGTALRHHATLLIASMVKGSAFYLAETLVTTNAHVVAGLTPGTAVTLRTGLAPETAVTAHLLAVSDRADIAFLRAPAGFLPSPDATARPPAAGATLRAAGLRAGLNGIEPVEVAGLATGRTINTAAFGVGLTVRMAEAGPGFSGGPAIDADGALIGMVAAIRRGGHMHPVGSAFAPIQRPTDTPQEVLVLSAALLQAEARRLLGPAWNVQ